MVQVVVRVGLAEGGIQSVGAKAVDRLGGQGNQPSGLERADRIGHVVRQKVGHRPSLKQMSAGGRLGASRD